MAFNSLAVIKDEASGKSVNKKFFTFAEFTKKRRKRFVKSKKRRRFNDKPSPFF
jgi:hypothetical protein